MNIRNEKLRKAYEGSYYTITGAGGFFDEDTIPCKSRHEAIKRAKRLTGCIDALAIRIRSINEVGIIKQIAV